MGREMKIDGEKPSLADMFKSAERNVRVSNPDAPRKAKPEWKFSGRPTGGLKPSGFKAKAELKF